MSGKTDVIINKSDIDDAFKSIYVIIKSNMQKSLEGGSGWITDSVLNHNVHIPKYNPLDGSSYIKLLKIIRSSKKRFGLYLKYWWKWMFSMVFS